MTDGNGSNSSSGAEPLRIERATLADLPSVERVVSLAQSAPMIVLGFGAPFVLTEHGSLCMQEEEKRRLIGEIASHLPDHTVFDSGGSLEGQMPRDHAERGRRAGEVVTGTARITVMKVVPRALVLENADALVEAARQYRALATSLITRLSAKLGAAPDEFAADPMFWHRFDQTGRLDAEWGYLFHGFECGFGNQRTGQDIEVRLGFSAEDEGGVPRPEFGVLDPYFFARFVASTPGHERVAGLFSDRYHDPCRALDVLLEAGRLRRVNRSRDGNQLGWGYVPAEE